jgi:hypothetical protein
MTLIMILGSLSRKPHAKSTLTITYFNGDIMYQEMFYTGLEEEQLQVTDMPVFIQKLRDRNHVQITILKSLPKTDAETKVLLKKFKTEILTMIKDNLELMKRNINSCVADYDYLFAVISGLEILKIQSHTTFDHFWRRTLTDSTRKAMKLVRTAALYEFDRHRAICESQNNYYGLKGFIARIMNKPVFSAHRANWPLSKNTDAYNYLNDIHNSIDTSKNCYFSHVPAYDKRVLSDRDRQYQENASASALGDWSRRI